MTKNYYTLKKHQSNIVLFDGYFDSLKSCIEQAIREHVDLSYVDLRHTNLACVTLDDAQMTGAQFHGTNLSGANLSEAVFDHANFSHCDLSDTCFCLSSLKDVNFDGASFSSTDMTNADIIRCQFSCESIFTVDLTRTATFQDCLFIHDHSLYTKMKRCPIVIQGLPKKLVILDDIVKIGYRYISKEQIKRSTYTELKQLFGTEILSYIQTISYNVEKHPFKDGAAREN